MADHPESTASADEVLLRLDALVAGRRKAVVLTHDNPDPDSMASAAGLALVLGERHGVSCTLAYGGIIGRAENRELVRVLRLPMTPIGRAGLTEADLVALVDTQPGAGNHSLPADQRLDIVIDHHPLRPGSEDAGLCFVSAKYGATSSMVTALIRAAGLEPPATLATALFYGVKSDTRSLGREADEGDTDAYAWLFPRSDQEILARIEHPQVPLSYFRAYHTAYEKARMYGNVIVADLGSVYLPDIVPEIAERLVSLEGVKWSVALGDFEGELYISVRTNDRRMNAGRHIQELTADLGGSAGGHGQMAGARLPLGEKPRKLRSEVLHRFLENYGVDAETPRPIV